MTPYLNATPSLLDRNIPEVTVARSLTGTFSDIPMDILMDQEVGRYQRIDALT